MQSKMNTVPRRRKLEDAILITVCVALCLGASAKPAYAYADPGSGLMAIQILGSTLAGFIFLTRKRILALIARIRKAFGKRQSVDGDGDHRLPPSPE
jgi:hypothetical protein